MGESNINMDLIIHRLDEIAFAQIELKKEFISKIEDVDKKLNELTGLEFKVKSNKDEIEELKLWKGNLDEIVSPTQLAKVMRDVDKLKTFKTQALMIWVVVQTIMSIALFFAKFTAK